MADEVEEQTEEAVAVPAENSPKCEQPFDDIKINRYPSNPGRGRGFPRGPRYVLIEHGMAK